MWWKNLLLLFSILGFLNGGATEASCRLEGRDPSAVTRIRDPLGLLLASSEKCPSDVFKLRERLIALGWKLEATLVANRGFHNPTLGSFSFFEKATRGEGEIFFGHFTRPGPNQKLVADQDPSRGALMVEAIAWDPEKGYYNFYELVGSGSEGEWHYRGDSADILTDNQFLHRQPDPDKPVFGNRMRCSACHLSGGPIMKELDAPHNDWWTKERGLDFGGRGPDEKLSKIMENLVPAERLAEGVVLSLKKLASSKGFQKVQESFSLQERLRPLFCPVELNFQSDHAAHFEGGAQIQVPTGFLVDSRWITSEPLGMRREDYLQALQSAGSFFPETQMLDADHAWLAPVKARSDQLAVDTLIERGVIDEEFVADVLAVDFTNPVFSQARCSLLKLLPAVDRGDWRGEYLERLGSEPSEAAQELYRNLSDPSRNRVAYQKKVFNFLERCRTSLLNPTDSGFWIQLLDQRRQEIRSSEISKNPRGQILEPGFRVIFPEIPRSVPPRQLKISQDCSKSVGEGV